MFVAAEVFEVVVAVDVDGIEQRPTNTINTISAEATEFVSVVFCAVGDISVIEQTGEGGSWESDVIYDEIGRTLIRGRLDSKIAVGYDEESRKDLRRQNTKNLLFVTFHDSVD